MAELFVPLKMFQVFSTFIFSKILNIENCVLLTFAKNLHCAESPWTNELSREDSKIWIHLSIYLSIHFSIFLSIYLSLYRSTYIYLSIPKKKYFYLSTFYLYIYLFSMYLSIYLGAPWRVPAGAPPSIQAGPRADLRQGC